MLNLLNEKKLYLISFAELCENKHMIQFVYFVRDKTTSAYFNNIRLPVKL